ncbi:hypothetical protein [Rhizobium rhizoryzae]|uniref:Uncharacterized protein n=1 Tax=Rhizobium rhizoryzae TaxID=451876 RepID=A0A7W6LKB7_9HYPH|nr:hypothetical protein [Rhizobium rhizoryzae]MBB4145806.1 hypothetical protein [Rhizobium rhizoryzae]
MASLLSAIRLAVGTGVQTHVHDLVVDEPDASASIPQTPQPEANSTGDAMSGSQTLAGAAQAVAAAVATLPAGSGGQDGAQAATDRLMTIFAADSIKGDAGRMSAAIELAAKAPAMSADDVVAFVASHVTAGTSASVAAAVPPQQSGTSAPAASYEQQRLIAAALAQPGNGGAHASKPKLNADTIYAARRNPQGA